MVDISVKNVNKFFVIGENLLEDLSFDIQEGERAVSYTHLTLPTSARV